MIGNAFIMDPFKEAELVKEPEGSGTGSRIMMTKPALEQDTAEVENHFINLQKVSSFKLCTPTSSKGKTTKKYDLIKKK